MIVIRTNHCSLCLATQLRGIHSSFPSTLIVAKSVMDGLSLGLQNIFLPHYTAKDCSEVNLFIYTFLQNILNMFSCAINPPMGNGHAIHVQHCTAAGTLQVPHCGIINKFIHSFIHNLW